ncbi:MAG TPA: metallophosphoesterase family protein [bacterium]|nr:metallophosphoesterase family protein [bacterium]
MIVGVIADTRELLSSAKFKELRNVFKGVDAILHAGPVGDVRVVDQLKKIAPTEAVCGNAESQEVRSELYVRAVWRSRGLKIGLIHGYGEPHSLMAWMLKQFENDPVDVIVYGNNFEIKARQEGNTYFFNPGSFSGRLPEGSRGTGPSRVGLLFIEGKKVEGQSLLFRSSET